MTEEKFVHLHNHSYYSLLDGLSSVEDLVQCAKDMGYKSLALTDHGSCAGLFKFASVCKDNGIKPILGMEAYSCPDHKYKEKGARDLIRHLLLLAKNTEGYKNLIKLSTIAYIDGLYYKPRLDFELLEKHKNGLIVSSACASGEIPNLLWEGKEQEAEAVAGKYREVFGDDFYIEIMSHVYYKDPKQEEKEKKLALMLYKLARKIGSKAICTQDTHYARKEEWEAQDILLSIQTLDTIKNPQRLSFGSQDFYLKPYEQMADLYKKVPELLLNTVEISEKIESNLITTGQDLLPHFKVPEGFKDEEDYLKALVTDGMKAKGLINKQEYRERIKYEMGVITKCKYTKYFLVLWDIINFTRSENIRIGVGRGSAVSSLCLYVLGITGLDPLKYDLLFERFLNPDRVSPPDVDVDFDYDRREEVYNYIIRKYGAEYCCQIGTYNSYGAKAVIRSTAKALDIGGDWETYQAALKKDPNTKVEMTKKSLDLADQISKLIPFKAGTTLEDVMKSNKDFAAVMKKYPKLLECARHIEGTLSAGGVHPAGIIVCKDPVIERIPLRNAKGVICSQFVGPEVESLGLLKFDLLALKTLTVIDKSLKMIKERHKKDIDIDKLDPVDKEVFKIFNGTDEFRDTKGVFQFEADGISKLLMAIRVDRFEDLIIANALYRPGPLGAGVHEMYCNYKHGVEEIKYLHPKMGEVLNETYGIMIFQENIMKIATHLAGFSRGKADTLRKVVGKKKPELIKKEKLDDLFIEGCAKNGIDKEIAKKIFEQICYFAGYGFNKSHSAAYAFIAYQTAWLKKYYPIEFMCNLLTSEINNNDKNEKLNIYIKAAERLRIICMPPDINRSGLGFKIEIGHHEKFNKDMEVLRKPLTMLNGVGTKAVDDIVLNQPYKDLEDFVRRTNARVVNTKVFATLVNSGGMDCWKIDREELLSRYDVIKEKLEKEKKLKAKQEKKKQEFGGQTIFDDGEFDYSGEKLNL